MHRSLSISALSAALLVLAGVDAFAQAKKVAVGTPVLLQRCTDIPEESACRAVLKRTLTPAQRSLALTYLAEFEEYSRDSLLRAAVKADPQNALAHFMLGNVYVGVATKERVGHLRTALALRPDWTSIRPVLAKLYAFQEGRSADTLVQLWRAAMEVDPGALKTRMALALALQGSGQFSAAEGEYRRVIAEDSTHAAAVAGLCAALLKQNKVRDANAPCMRAIRGWNGNHGDELRSIASYAEDNKAYELALVATEQGLAEDPTSSFYLSDQTRLLSLMHREAEADSVLLAHVAKYPEDQSALESAADLMYYREKLPLARDLYVRLLTRRCGTEGRVCTSKGNLALTYLRLNMIPQAFAWLDSALTHQADCPDLVSSFRSVAAKRPDSAAVMAKLRIELNSVGGRFDVKANPRGAADFFASIGDWERAVPAYRIAVDSTVEMDRRYNGSSTSYVRWQYGHALLEVKRYCEALPVLEAARAADAARGLSEYETDLLDRARKGCVKSP